MWLLLLSCVFSLMHSTAPLALVLAITCEVCRRLVAGRFNWQVVVATAAGLAIGTLLHPNFPENLTVQTIQAWQIPRSFLAPPPVTLGGEAYPYSTKQLLIKAPVGLFCLVAAGLAMARRDRRLGHDSLTLLCVCIITLAMTALSRRFVELFCPVAVLFLATIVRDWAPAQWPARR